MLPFYAPLKTRKMQGFFGVLRGYKMETLTRNGLKGQLSLVKSDVWFTLFLIY